MTPEEESEFPIQRHLEALGVTAGASDAEIKRRYRALVREHHPDHVLHSDAARARATKEFKRVQAAYEFLRRLSPAERTAMAAAGVPEPAAWTPPERSVSPLREKAPKLFFAVCVGVVAIVLATKLYPRLRPARTLDASYQVAPLPEPDRAPLNRSKAPLGAARRALLAAELPPLEAPRPPRSAPAVPAAAPVPRKPEPWRGTVEASKGAFELEVEPGVPERMREMERERAGLVEALRNGVRGDIAPEPLRIDAVSGYFLNLIRIRPDRNAPGLPNFEIHALELNSEGKTTAIRVAPAGDGRGLELFVQKGESSFEVWYVGPEDYGLTGGGGSGEGGGGGYAEEGGGSGGGPE